MRPALCRAEADLRPHGVPSLVRPPTVLPAPAPSAPALPAPAPKGARADSQLPELPHRVCEGLLTLLRREG